MATYRELLARRNEFSIYSPEWKEIGDLIDAYVRAQILAGHMEFANMIGRRLGRHRRVWHLRERPRTQEGVRRLHRVVPQVELR